MLFFYAAFSTIFLETSLVGNIGEKIGTTNLYLFGYFAYVNIFILFYPFYKLYTDPTIRKKWDFYMGWILFIVAVVIFSSLVLEKENIGYVGTELVTFLYPFIGTAGLWMLWVMSVMLSILFIVDDDFSWSDLSSEGSLSSNVDYVLLDKLLLPFRTLKEKISNTSFSSSSSTDEFMPLMESEAKVTKSKKKPTTKAIKKPLTTKKEMKTIVDTIKEREKAETKPRGRKKTEIYEDKEVDESQSLTKNSKNSNVVIVEELEENSKLMKQIEKGTIDKPNNFNLPRLDFLQKAPKATKKINEVEIDRKIEELLAKLKHFKVDGDVIRTYSGPLVTTFEFKPAPNVKVSKILNLQDDLAMALSAETIRIQAPIPGRDVVGIEIPNVKIDTIYLREILEDKVFKESKSSLTVALGKDIVGKPFITDLKKLPHLLIAGTTGSGKSVGINAMILSLLYRNDPDHLKLMLIDPKMLEFSMYNDIPHLITPVITEPIKAIAALANMVGEMERRYKLMADSRTKNIENYNEKAKKEGNEPFPFIVIVIDELADLMMNGGKEVELSIARLAQKSRACGIHLIVATQRPSVDVVTGLIKANLPSRLSYRVSQRIDSKVILDAMGAESLLGRGDGLFTPPGSTGLVRIHAPWNSEDEIDEVVEYLKAQRVPEYDESYLVVGGATAATTDKKEVTLDALYEEAKSVVLTDQKTSISYLQRKLQIGYNRSANIIEQLQEMGVLSAPNNKGQREIML